eukprot:11169395-Lingulodinium_polyedra.AAC.1
MEPLRQPCVLPGRHPERRSQGRQQAQGRPPRDSSGGRIFRPRLSTRRAPSASRCAERRHPGAASDRSRCLAHDGRPP